MYDMSADLLNFNEDVATIEWHLQVKINWFYWKTIKTYTEKHIAFNEYMEHKNKNK